MEITELASADVLRVLMARMQHERITQNLTIETDYGFPGKQLNVSPSNSMLLSFADRTGRPNGIAYRLLFILSLRSETVFNDELRDELHTARTTLNAHRMIVWSAVSLPTELSRALKRLAIEPLYLTPHEHQNQKAIPFFLPLRDKSHEYDVMVNATADLLTKRLKKLFHLVLSEIAAPKYDTMYGKQKVATREMMQWEEDEVVEVAKRLKACGRDGLAVDVGCGTGRHTFPLSEYFKEVYAFDFSPRMIAQAVEHKKKVDDKKIFFETLDIEYEPVPSGRVLDEQGQGKADLVLASFGMGSFVEDTVTLLRKFHGWLKPGGFLIISFYNADALLLNVKTNWRDTSLSAHLDRESKTLCVELDDETLFHIFCQPYSKDVLGQIKGVFQVDRVSTFPSLMALMPNSLFSTEMAARVFKRVDRILGSEWQIRQILQELIRRNAGDPTIAQPVEKLLTLFRTDSNSPTGYYSLVVGRKVGAEVNGLDRVEFALSEAGCQGYEFIEHAHVQNVADVIREIGDFRDRMVKTVVFKYRPTKTLFVIVLFSHKRIHKNRLAESLGLSPGPFVYAPETDVLRLGFHLGALAPFGFATKSQIRLIIDTEIIADRKRVLYCGCGDNMKTLKIRASDFKRIVEDYEEQEIPVSK